MAAPPPVPEGARATITLTGEQETLLVALHARHRDALTPRPILGDRWAGYVAEQIAYDFAKLKVSAGVAAYVSLRARQLDRWAVAFLKDHRDATVVHLACGLDSRSHRIAWQDVDGDGGDAGGAAGAGAAPKTPRRVRWIDLDLPDVVELRRKLLPDPPGDYALVSASVFDDDWLLAIPADRPTVVVAEGLTMYLPADKGREMLARLCRHFSNAPAAGAAPGAAPGGGPGGELLFDATGWIIVALQSWFSWLRTTGAEMRWSVDDPRELETLHEGLRLLDDKVVSAMEGVEEFPLLGRVQMWVSARLPGFRYVGRILRYAF